MPGRSCAVVGCTNSHYKLKKWREKICQFEGVPHSECSCLEPFKLHIFPRNEEMRRQWIKNINRKNFKPGSGVAVCSLHFVDGRPTELNPYPTMNLGYDYEKLYAKRHSRKQLCFYNGAEEISLQQKQSPNDETENPISEMLEQSLEEDAASGLLSLQEQQQDCFEKITSVGTQTDLSGSSIYLMEQQLQKLVRENRAMKNELENLKCSQNSLESDDTKHHIELQNTRECGMLHPPSQ